MGATKFLAELLFLQLIARTCHAGIVIEQRQYSSSLVKATARILTSCYKSRVTTIGIAGNLPDSLIASLSNEGQFSLVLIDNTTRSVDNGPISRFSKQKLPIFVITPSTSTRLREILQDIKNSRWWNHEAQFYIIDWTATKKASSRAAKFLRIAWRMNILEAKFIGTKGTKKMLLYSFNPYTSDAPDPWKLKRTYSVEKNRSWSLLVRKYAKNRDICENLDFDKTTDLGGHEIRVNAFEDPTIRLRANETAIDSLNGVFGDIFRTIFRSINATVELQTHKSAFELGGTQFDHQLADIKNAISDIGLNGWRYMGDVNLTRTYPHYYTGLSVMTQYNGDESQITKIISLIDVWSRIGVGIVFLVTMIYLIYFLRQTPMTAVLNTIRVFCNSCLTKLPSSTSSRIYLSALFIFVVTILGIYQSTLSSLLAKRVPLPDIETMDDLAKSGHTIYGQKRYSVYFDDRAFQGRFVGTESFNCTEQVIRDASAACVGPWSRLLPEAARSRLHLSRDLIIQYPANLIIRADWPLEHKINAIIQQLVEANRFEYSYVRAFEKELRNIRENDSEKTEWSYKVLNLGDLNFAFVILGIGLGLSTISFIVEVLVRRRAFLRILKNRNAKKPVIGIRMIVRPARAIARRSTSIECLARVTEEESLPNPVNDEILEVTVPKIIKVVPRRHSCPEIGTI